MSRPTAPPEKPALFPHPAPILPSDDLLLNPTIQPPSLQSRLFLAAFAYLLFLPCSSLVTYVFLTPETHPAFRLICAFPSPTPREAKVHG